ncbi:hypothetical protein EG329_000376 [Mollisiaceae sp. DMI_Dod_QoI]|nr:hypothetical protein EG329_000376 [Helotiales sp. DMI_Dod_QoI]
MMFPGHRFNSMSWFGVTLLLNLGYFPLALANWRYKTRPDLSPPTLNITVHAKSDIGPGYLFVAPYSALPWNSPLPHGPLQPAPYIFTSTGELVWSGFGYFSNAFNFQAGRYKGEDVLFAFEGHRNGGKGHGHGHVKILNKNYETIKEVRGGGNALLDLHELKIVDEKTALVESYGPTPFELQEYGAGPRSQWIVDAIFQEIDIETGRLLFEWNSLDHVKPDESIKPISSLKFGTGHNSSSALDYFHLNSVDADSSHNYLISGRHTSTLYKINGTTGSIIWRLGGKFSNFTLGPGIAFGLQHHARWISQNPENDTEIISLFDNSGAEIKDSGEEGEYENISSGKIISLNTKTWTATLLQHFPAPSRDIFAASQGSTQILPNGNALINWGSAGSITEFSPGPDPGVLFHAYLESGELWSNSDVQNYRAFNFQWEGVGVSGEEIAVKALRHGGSTMVYVSWNGDTVTTTWRIWGVSEAGTKVGTEMGKVGKGKEVLLGEVKKEGFETSVYVKSGSDWEGFLVEAVGGEAKVLGRSRVVGIEEYVYQYVPGRDDFLSTEEGFQNALGLGLGG